MYFYFKRQTVAKCVLQFLFFHIRQLYGGGRNGFIYIQGISKQDTAIAIGFLISLLSKAF